MRNFARFAGRRWRTSKRRDTGSLWTASQPRSPARFKNSKSASRQSKTSACRKWQKSKRLKEERYCLAMEISGSTILVTGGSSGLGAACVEALVERGARVVIADLAPPREAIKHLDRTHFVATDVTSEDAVRAAISAGE